MFCERTCFKKLPLKYRNPGTTSWPQVSIRVPSEITFSKSKEARRWHKWIKLRTMVSQRDLKNLFIEITFKFLIVQILLVVFAWVSFGILVLTLSKFKSLTWITLIQAFLKNYIFARLKDHDVLPHAIFNFKWFGFLTSFSRYLQGRNMLIRKLWLLLGEVVDDTFAALKDILGEDIVS